MRLRYDTGSAFGFVRGGAIVVLPEGATSELVGRLWDGLDAAGDADVEVIEVIQLLTVVLGATLRTMPPFAVAVVSGRRAQVAVRGEVSVTLSTSSARVHVDGDDVTTWSERLVDDVEEISVQLGVEDAPALEAGPGQVALVGLPLHEGVVLVSRIVRQLAGTSAAPTDTPRAEHTGIPAAVAAPAGPVVRPASAFEPVLVGSAVPTEDEDLDPALAAVPSLVAVDLGPDDDAAPVALVAAVPGLDAAADEVVPTQPQVDERSAETIVSMETIAPELTVVPPAGDLDADGDLDDLVGLDDVRGLDDAVAAVDDGYGHLWESTVLRTVEDAAIRIDEEDEQPDSPAPVPAPAPAAVPSVEIVTPVPAPPAGTPLPVAGMIDGIPREWTGSTPAASVRAATVAGDQAQRPGPEAATGQDLEGDDHDGHTVFSSVIADLRAQVSGAGAATAVPAPPAPLVLPGAAAPLGVVPAVVPVAGPAPVGSPAAGPTPAVGPAFSPPAPPGSQQILARTCVDGHANPPSRDTCGSCAQVLVGDAHLVTRPSLGRFTLSNGQVVELDRPVVLGRRPRTTRAQSNDLPRLVAVPSPEQDISRSHVEIQLEGWHVLVCDLNTTNGTTLLRPGQPPRRLHPGEPAMVVSHDVVDVGDGVTFTFEGLL
ncbi:FHA domain-containing protein [Oerskovia sp. KBS0722]|uniref:FHA domain-containing protein n=1 Tax=Oerskovia sp. KBS0722 TaxID=1179673 RepID=UPI00110DC8AA|nr:FHA domain-containing protein [Oerskovia sp. KBS0722]QDW62536.1 FHA domain-containing protein [Oerskovia sp. KBS0722]